jgi:hypothetical protein
MRATALAVTFKSTAGAGATAGCAAASGEGVDPIVTMFAIILVSLKKLSLLAV